MRAKLRRRGIAIGVAAILAMLGAVPTATSSSAPSGATRAYDWNRNKFVYKPGKFEPIQGYLVKQVHWRGWHRSTASGKGRVAGIKVKVKLRRPKLCENYDVNLFANVKLTSTTGQNCAVICASGGPFGFIDC